MPSRFLGALLALCLLPLALRAGETGSGKEIQRIEAFREKYREIELRYSRARKAGDPKAVADHSRALAALAADCRRADQPGFEEMAWRRILDDDPDHREARKRLGYAQIDGRWLTRWAAAKARKGWRPYQAHGWVPKEDLARLEKGLLPLGKEWLPRSEAAASAGSWEKAMVLLDDKWELRSNASYERSLELLSLLGQEHDLLTDLFEGEIKLLENAQRYRVNFHASRASYDEANPEQRGQSNVLGFFSPVSNTGNFYELPGKGMSTECVMLHEAMHQITHNLMRFNMTGGAPNFFLVEGFADYLSMYEPASPGGELRLCPLKEYVRWGRLRDLYRQGAAHPLKGFVELPQSGYESDEYAQGSIFCRYLLHGAGGRYRKGFIRYVTITRIQGDMTTRRFAECLGKPPEAFDAELEAYVLAGEDDSRLHPIEEPAK